MKNNPVFNVIDIETWPRKFYFEHYYHHVKCTRSITVNIDIQLLLNVCKKKSVKLYPAMIYMITTAVNQIDELRTVYNEKGQLGQWDFMSPSYTVFHPEDKTFSNIWTPYDKDFSVFYHHYLDDIKKYGNVKDFMAKGNEPGNTFPVSCNPWVEFTGFNLNIYDRPDYLCPIFTFGKYHQQDNKMVIPIAAQLHHATSDGYHVGLLFDAIKKLALTAEEWIDV
ncbi:MAG TPA: type A chloramphenicol O-acetyltransferase [Gammaproteobacteria bacterium]|nr:type A chloramphenicol O-acetyltransferase [Gammaproteobacteria bacterium]